MASKLVHSKPFSALKGDREWLNGAKIKLRGKGDMEAFDSRLVPSLVRASLRMTKNNVYIYDKDEMRRTIAL